jgi:UPF0716 family protein affecting phage T7 exclusion
MKAFLLRINRWAAWLTLLYMMLFTLTGFAMVGMWGMDNVINVRTAARLHSSPYTIYPMLLAVLVHSLFCIHGRISKWMTKR